MIGKFFIKYPDFIADYTFKWNQSNNKWLQRMSILFQLMYRDKTNTTLLTEYIEHCALEEDFFIRKAIGWALREYGKCYPNEVKSFVNQTTLKPLSKKEALKNIP